MLTARALPSALAATVLLLISSAQPVAHRQAPAASLACDGWQDYVVGPPSRELHPVRAMQRDGAQESELDVSLVLATDRAGVRLQREGTNATQLVLDFGEVISGKIEMDSAASSSPLVVFSTSESLQYLRIGSDTQAYGNGDLTNRPGPEFESWHTPHRRTFRYLLVSLADDGWAEVDRVGVYYTGALGPAEAFQGMFVSSDPLLNRIWYRSAYTLQLVTAPGTSTVLDGSLETWRGQMDMAAPAQRRLALTAFGGEWRDYTLDLELTLIPGSPGMGWTVRASEEAYPAFRLVARQGNTPAQLQVWRGNSNGASMSREQSLPIEVLPGRAYHVRMEVLGDEGRIWVDGQLVGQEPVPDFPGGRVGLWAVKGDHFTVADIRVISANGEVMFADDFDGEHLDPALWRDAPRPMLLDGAKRDRALGLGDLPVAARASYLSFGRSDLVRRLLQELASYQHPSGKLPGGIMWPDRRSSMETPDLPDYSLWWVMAVYDYFMETGDEGLVRAVLPNVKAVMEWAERGRRQDGLLQKGPGIDWYWSADRGPGATTALNALYYGALGAAASLAASHGRPDLHDRYLSLADEVGRATNAAFWDAAAGAYVDGESLRDVHPLDGNALAVLYGLAPLERSWQSLAHVRANLWSPWGTRTADRAYGGWAHDHTIWPAYVYREVEARFSIGDDEGAIELMRRTWGNMLERDPRSTFWEFAAPDGGILSGDISLAHGWSSGALPALSRYVLGVAPREPGYRRLTVAPHPSGLAWACGVVPTPRGPLKVAWRLVDGRYSQASEAPEGTISTLAVPWRGHAWAEVWLDGRQVWPPAEAMAPVRFDETGSFLYLDDVPPGSHVITACGSEGADGQCT
jgi:hypothetical protein